jgi:hypothetical protein
VPVTWVFRNRSRLVCNYQREAIMKKLVALAGLLVLSGALGVILVGRDSDHASASTGSPAQTRANQYPYKNPIKRKGSSSPRLSGDGRYFGYVQAADADARPPTISFDVAQFFFGNSVQKAAEEDGAVAPGEPVSNDHYERDRTQEIRVLPLAPDVQVTSAPPGSFLMSHMSHEALSKCDPNSQATCILSLTGFFGALKELDYRPGIPTWVTTHDGLVVRIDEQYFP